MFRAEHLEFLVRAELRNALTVRHPTVNSGDWAALGEPNVPRGSSGRANMAHTGQPTVNERRFNGPGRPTNHLWRGVRGARGAVSNRENRSMEAASILEWKLSVKYV